MFVKCPECGQEVVMVPREADHLETHGLECGPYEHWHDEWWECPKCSAKFDERDLVGTESL